MTAVAHTTTTRRIGRAEWTKLRTLPSTWRTAVKTVTAEYSAGMIRATFTAMPARPLVLAAKAATVAAFAVPVALFCNVAGFELGQRIFASHHARVAIGHRGAPQAMVFGALAGQPCPVTGKIGDD
jgi:hypothetical protein